MFYWESKNSILLIVSVSPSQRQPQATIATLNVNIANNLFTHFHFKSFPNPHTHPNANQTEVLCSLSLRGKNQKTFCKMPMGAPIDLGPITSPEVQVSDAAIVMAKLQQANFAANGATYRVLRQTAARFVEKV